MENKNIVTLARACALGVLTLSGIGSLLVRGSLDSAAEHGPMENFQALCLLCGGVALWLQARPVTDAGGKHALKLASLGYITMFLLEFDVRPFAMAPVTWLLNGPVRNLWLGALWVYCLTQAIPKWRAIVMQGKLCLRSAVGVVIVLAAVFWIAGAAVERLKPYSGIDNVFAEEFMETQAAVLMLWGAAEVYLARSRRFRVATPSASAAAYPS